MPKVISKTNDNYHGLNIAKNCIISNSLNDFYINAVASYGPFLLPQQDVVYCGLSDLDPDTTWGQNVLPQFQM